MSRGCPGRASTTSSPTSSTGCRRSWTAGEISVEVTGLQSEWSAPQAADLLDARHRTSDCVREQALVQRAIPWRRRRSRHNCITFKAVLGDNSNSVEVDDCFANVFILDPTKVYLWQAFWSPVSFRLVVEKAA